jgi:WD40 repeat protein
MFKAQMFLRIVLLIVLIGGSIGCTVPDTTPIQQWRHVEEGAYAADISTDGTLSVLSGVDNGINVWRIGESEPLYHWGHQGEGNNLVMSVHISADKRYVVTADREAFALWSLESGEPEGFWRIDESSIRDVAVANNGQGVLVARSNGQVMYFEPRTSRRLEFLGHQEKVNSIDISPNGKYALTGGNDYIAYLWSTETGQIIHTFTHPTRVTKVALDDEGRYAFTADSKSKSQIWDVQTGQAVSALNFASRQKIFTDVEFSKDGQYLLTGSPSRKVYLWDLKTGNQLQAIQVASRETISPPTAVVYGVAFMPDGNIVSASSSGLAEVWQRE